MFPRAYFESEVEVGEVVGTIASDYLYVMELESFSGGSHCEEYILVGLVV